MKRLSVIVALLAVIAIQGCATKTYGRQDDVTTHDKESMVCREINLEVIKTREFINQVNKESAFSGLDVLAILVDFGIGNHIEKNAALESADTRMATLRQLRDEKRCDTTLL